MSDTNQIATQLGANFALWARIEHLLRSSGPTNPCTPRGLANNPSIKEVARRPGDAQEISSVLQQLHKKGYVLRPAVGEYYWNNEQSTPASTEKSAKKEHHVVDKLITKIETSTPTKKVRRLIVNDGGVTINLTLSHNATVTIDEV